MKNNYNLRHKDIFNPDNQRFKIKCFGIGSLGSLIVFTLAKMGITNIEVWDFDYVEPENVGVQLYRVKDIGKSKCEALKEIIKEFCDIEIVIHEEKVTKESKIEVGFNDLFVLSFDTLESRKMFFDLIKDYKCDVLDVRAGGLEYNIQIINTFNEKELEKWKKSFDIVPTDLPCGERSILYTNFSITSEVCNIVKKMNNNEVYPKKIIRHMKSYSIINDLKDK